MTRIRNAIFPVAGLGTRFLPATKAMPKEMLPVVDRPLIQHVVDEARQAGIEHFIFVTGRSKSVIEDHFDRQIELETTLVERGKKADLALLSQDMPGPGTASPPAIAARPRPYYLVRARTGRQRAVRAVVTDVLVQNKRGCLAQMIDAAKGSTTVPISSRWRKYRPTVHMYGVVGVGGQGQGVLDHQDGREAEGFERRQSHHNRALHFAAASF
jgi:UTP--glucose-1-phosphate uridylyltransferase